VEGQFTAMVVGVRPSSGVQGSREIAPIEVVLSILATVCSF